MSITTAKLKNLFILTLFIMIGMITMNMTTDVDTKYKLTLVLTFLSFVIVLITNPYHIVSPYTFIILFIYVYNCGQLWLDLFGIPIEDGSFVITRFSKDALIESAQFFLLMTIGIHAFCVLFTTAQKKQYDFEHNLIIVNEETKIYLRLLYRVFFICLPFILVFDISQIATARLLGYSAALYSRSENMLLSTANSFFPFAILGIIICETNRRKRLVIAIMGAFRYVLTMIFVGYRMQAMAFLCVLFVAWNIHGSNKELRKKAMLVVLLGIVLLLGSNIIWAWRTDTAIGNVSIWDTLVKSIRELGATFIDLPILIGNIDSIGYGYGRTYFYGIVNLIPLLIRLFPDANQYLALSARLNDHFQIYSNASLGGSIYAELFMNFGWYSLLLTPLCGYLLTRLNNRIKKRATAYTKNIEMYVFFIIVLYIRGNMAEVTVFFRNILYMAVLYNVFVTRHMRNKRMS